MNSENELLDICDEKGTYLRFAKTRKEAHILGLWHQTVHGWIINERCELLLQKRSSEKDTYPNYWDISFAGHIKSGHTILQTLEIEAEEELGIVTKSKDFKFIGKFKNSNIYPKNKMIDNEINHVFILKKNISESEITLADSEVEEIKYVSVSDLKKLIEDKSEQIVPHAKEYKLLFQYIETNFDFFYL